MRKADASNDESPPTKRLRTEYESAVTIGDESFETRDALMTRVKELQTAGEHEALTGGDLALIEALMKLHPTLNSVAASNFRFGEHSRFPGSKCFLVCVNEGQRDEKDEPASFKKVVDQLFPRQKKTSTKNSGAGGGVSSGACAPKESASASIPSVPPEEGQKHKVGEEGVVPTTAATPKYGAVAPPPAAAAATGSSARVNAGGKGSGQGGAWFDKPGAGLGTVVVAEGLGRVNPYGGGANVKQLKESFSDHGKVAFVDLVETEGRCFVRFNDVEGAASAGRNPTPLRGLVNVELRATVLSSDDHEAYVARARRASAAAEAKQQRQRPPAGKNKDPGHYSH